VNRLRAESVAVHKLRTKRFENEPIAHELLLLETFQQRRAGAKNASVLQACPRAQGMCSSDVGAVEEAQDAMAGGVRYVDTARRRRARSSDTVAG
jgi:hypothetical protein